jgi:hypothetical protein
MSNNYQTNMKEFSKKNSLISILTKEEKKSTLFKEIANFNEKKWNRYFI